MSKDNPEELFTCRIWVFKQGVDEVNGQVGWCDVSPSLSDKLIKSGVAELATGYIPDNEIELPTTKDIKKKDKKTKEIQSSDTKTKEV